MTEKPSRLGNAWQTLRKVRWDWAYLVILVVALIAHGLLLLNDWEYWDGPAVHAASASRDFAGQVGHYSASGVPLFGVYLAGMGYFSNITLAFRVSGFLCLLLTAFFTYRIGLHSGYLSKVESLIVAVLAMLYPVFQASVISDITGYMLGNLFFIIGAMLALQMERKKGTVHWLLRVLAWLFFYLGSHFTNSLYVFYFGFLFFWAFYVMRLHSMTLGGFLRGYLWRRIDLVVLPFVAWGIRLVFYPVSGGYVGYNAFNLDPGSIWFWIKSYFTLGIFEPYITLLVRHPWFTVAVVLALLVIYLDRHQLVSRLGEIFTPGLRSWKLFGFGLILLALAILPYAIVGKGPTHSVFSDAPFDTDTRQCLLVGLPVAILIMGLVRALILSRIRTLSALGVALLVVITIESSMVHIENYVDWQIRSVKDQSLIAQLQESEAADPYSIVWVDDSFPAGGYRFVADKAFYVYSEWQWIGDFIWPEYGHSLIDASYRQQVPYYYYYNIDTDKAGCQAVMVLTRNPEAGSDWNILAHYYYYKFLKPDQMQAYLATRTIRVTSIQFSPLVSSSATNCTLP